MVVEAQAREDQAMEVRQARRIARLVAELLDVVDGEDGLSDEALVERLDILAREGLDLARERHGRLRFPEVGEVNACADLFGNQDVVGAEQAAESVHHLAEAVLGIELVHARADDVVDGELLEQDLLVCLVALHVVVEIDAETEMAGLAVPRDECMAEETSRGRDGIVVDVREACIGAELVFVADLADGIVAR